MGERNQSLDFLRGLSIFGMIFSAIIPYGVLPAWMYHIQNPPPSHDLDMSVPGIGWVDLVFPVFIFCMGVAIPLSWKNGKGAHSGGRRLCGEGVQYVKGVFVRFLRLWAFSYLYVLMNFSNLDALWPQVFTIVGFSLIFMLYYKPSVKVMGYGERGKSKGWRIVRNLVGIYLVAVVMVVGHYSFGEVIGLHRRGIIIFLLAFLYLFGSLVWYFTRERIGVRATIFALLLIFTHVTRQLDWPAITYANPQVNWWFNMEYIYFLLLLLPATVVGDILRRREQESVATRRALDNDVNGGVAARSELCMGEQDEAAVAQEAVPDIGQNTRKETGKETGHKGKNGSAEHLISWLCLLFVVWQCYALYMNEALLNMAVSVPVVALLVLLCRRYSPLNCLFVAMAGLLVIWGISMGTIEDGIKKVPCTISYCLATCGISIYLLLVAQYICKFLGKTLLAGIFTGAGRNPLMAYITYGSLLVPLMKLCGVMPLYASIYSAPDGNPLWGILRAAAATLLAMWIVSCFSRKGIFWKA